MSGDSRSCGLAFKYTTEETGMEVRIWPTEDLASHTRTQQDPAGSVLVLDSS